MKNLSITRFALKVLILYFLGLFSLAWGSFSLSGLARAEFSDVYRTDMNYAAITSLIDQGILEGYEDGTFRSDQEVNRAEALKIILMGTDVDMNEESTAAILFSDVHEEDWFFGTVSTAVSQGIVQGYEDGSFRPEQTVNRAEAMKMLLKAAEVSVETEGVSFADVEFGTWYEPYAVFAKSSNIEPPQTDGLWHAEEAITRGNIAEMVYRLQQTEARESAFDEAQNWLYKDFPTVDIRMKVPFSWGYKQEGVGAVFLLDREHGQVSLLTPYENGGTLLLTRFVNADGESTADLFEEIRAHVENGGAVESAGSELETNVMIEETAINGYPALVLNHKEGVYTREWYLLLDNGSLLHVVALRGDGAYAPYLDWFFEAMVASVEYTNSTTSELTIEETVEALREAIQVDGVGKEMMELLSDWELFETDAIGVGTGPVDYYYSPSANITVKYERSFDVILDLREGETSAF